MNLKEFFLIESLGRRKFEARLKTLAMKNGGKIPLTHETGFDEFNEIKNSGVINEGSFFHIGHFNKPYWRNDHAVIILINIPLQNMKNIFLGMVGSSDDEEEKYEEMFEKYPTLENLEVSLNIDVPLRWFYKVLDNKTMKPIEK